MTNKEAIEIIKLAIAEVQWEYPIDYAAAFDKAIDALKKLSLIERVIADESGFVDDNFGNNELGSLYIDALTSYTDKEEQELAQSWVRSLRPKNGKE